MSELIKLTDNDVGGEQIKTVNGRDLHAFLGNKDRYTTWIQDRITQFGFIENQDYVTFSESSEKGRPRKEFALTIGMAKELCMMSHTERGKQVRRYFIQLEKKWNDPKEVVKRGYEILQSENAQLRLENQQMKPKALFADAVSTSNTSILIGQLAKIMKQNGVDIGQNRLFTWMRENGYLGKRGQNYNRPTQMAMNMGLLEVKERTVNNPDGSVRITFTTMVTGKGQQYFINKFLGDHKMAE